ncbi:MAG: hypothetical protein ABEJ91_00005 [Candidatus Nanohaloarchaea archaeon]
MRKAALFLTVALLAGSAYGFDASMAVEDRKASSGSPGKFLVKVENTAPEAKIFQVSVSPYTSWFYTESSRIVPAGENHTFELIVTPPEQAIQQNYRFDAAVTAGGKTEKFTDYFTVEREEDLLIKAFSSDQKSYRPGETARLQVTVLNTAPYHVKDYRLRARILNSATEKQGLPLPPGSSGRLALNIAIPENAPPGETPVRISVIRNDEVRQTINQTISVERIRRIERSADSDNRLLFYTRTSTIENSGNFPVNATINETLPDYLKPITSFSPEPEEAAPGEDTTVYSWSYRLGPGESRSVSYTTDYWIPGSILVLLVAGLLVLKKVRTRVSFEKRARETEEGVKVHIELENHSGDPVKDVTVRDFVPDIASVVEKFPMATPVIRRTSNGTRLSWEIEELEPGSQRVFEYTIQPMFEVEGGVELPAAKLESGDRTIDETGEASAEFHPGDT